MNKFLWVDVETTGLDPKKNTVHQVAGQIVTGGKIQESFNFKMRPHDGAEVLEEALAVSKLDVNEVMARELTSYAAYKEFDKILCRYVNKYDKNDKFIFCAYNAQFDAQFIYEWYMRNGNKYFFGLCEGGAYFDPLQLAILIEIKKGMKLFTPNRKLETMAKHFGIVLDAHDALADITATRQVAYNLWGMLHE